MITIVTSPKTASAATSIIDHRGYQRWLAWRGNQYVAVGSSQLIQNVSAVFLTSKVIYPLDEDGGFTSTNSFKCPSLTFTLTRTS